MSEYKNFGQVGAFGDKARSDSNQFLQPAAPQPFDLAQLAAQLALVRMEMEKLADPGDSNHNLEIGVIAKAETAAKSGDQSKALGILKGGGKWALDVAKSITASIVKDAIEGKIGI